MPESTTPAPYDLIVVGFGAAGLATALTFLEQTEGREQPARIAVLERSAREDRGGATRWTGAFLRITEDRRLDTDWADHVDRVSGGLADADYCRTVEHEAPQAIAFIEKYGVEVAFQDFPFPHSFQAGAPSMMPPASPVGGGAPCRPPRRGARQRPPGGGALPDGGTAARRHRGRGGARRGGARGRRPHQHPARQGGRAGLRRLRGQRRNAHPLSGRPRLRPAADRPRHRRQPGRRTADGPGGGRGDRRPVRHGARRAGGPPYQRGRRRALRLPVRDPAERPAGALLRRGPRHLGQHLRAHRPRDLEEPGAGGVLDSRRQVPCRSRVPQLAAERCGTGAGRHPGRARQEAGHRRRRAGEDRGRVQRGHRIAGVRPLPARRQGDGRADPAQVQLGRAAGHRPLHRGAADRRRLLHLRRHPHQPRRPGGHRRGHRDPRPVRGG
ncbi:FAD-binding protein [Streptacidiphilus sp. 4-A2]|nr:FAD-binding protein [Streptacidiphilus sp. 4-A2]